MNRKNRKQVRKTQRRMQRRERALDKFYAVKDPLGVDTQDFAKAVHKMLDRVKSGRAKEAVRVEIAAFENRLMRA